MSAHFTNTRCRGPGRRMSGDFGTVSETVFRFPDATCVRYCLCSVTRGTLPHCNCWKAKPVEIGQGAVRERDGGRFVGSSSSFSRLFCYARVCAWKVACYEPRIGVSELWKTLFRAPSQTRGIFFTYFSGSLINPIECYMTNVYVFFRRQYCCLHNSAGLIDTFRVGIICI